MIPRHRFVAAVLAACTSTATVSAQPAHGAQLLVDGFRHLKLQGTPGATFYVYQSGVDLDTSMPTRYEDYYGDGTSSTVEREGFLRFLRLSQYPGQVAGFYYNAEVAEKNSGFAYGETSRWHPAPRHPVVMLTRFRFSDDYRADCTGAAIGSAGAWLWNSPIDYENYELHPMTGIGFSYADCDSVAGAGFNVGIYRNDFPEFLQAVGDIDLHEWNTFQMVWSEDATGTQSLSFSINWAPVATYTLPEPIDAELSLELWNDNQHPEYDPESGVVIVLDTPLAEQFFDIDFVAITGR